MKNRLEELRKQRGIKQEDLANALEVSRQTIGSLENGRYNPSIQLAFKIARYFNMSIEEIFIYEEDKRPSAPGSKAEGKQKPCVQRGCPGGRGRPPGNRHSPSSHSRPVQSVRFR